MTLLYDTSISVEAAYGAVKQAPEVTPDQRRPRTAAETGREVANHFKWLANVFPVTFLFVGVRLRARGLLDEGLTGADAAFSQTARRWDVLTVDPLQAGSKPGPRHPQRLSRGVRSPGTA
jgi:hypothetical protein